VFKGQIYLHILIRPVSDFVFLKGAFIGYIPFPCSTYTVKHGS
jgi:hypothetical protein